MSLDEAKKATASFQSGGFVPPPRTINDITAILDQQRLDNPKAAAEARAIADEVPPTSADPQALATSYYRRATAAREIRRGQEIRDLTEAARHAAQSRSLPQETMANILADLGVAEIYGGRFSQGLTHLREAIDVASSPGQRGLWISLNARLARYSTLVGDLETSERALRLAVAGLSESRAWPNQRPDVVARRNGVVKGAQASVLEAKGRFAEAENYHRQSIAAWSGNAIAATHPSLEGQVSRYALLLAREGRLAEAEHQARAALLGALRKFGRNSSHTANMLRVLTRVVAEQGRYPEAERLARAAIDIQQQIGASSDSLGMAGARDELGAVLAAQGRWREAVAEYDAIRSAMAEDVATFERYFAGSPHHALALIQTGRADLALDALERAIGRKPELASDGDPAAAELRGLTALARAALGQRDLALRDFASATPSLVNRLQEVDVESPIGTARDRRVTLILSSYISLLAEIRGSALEREAVGDAAAEAFRLADVARARAVQRALDAGAARAAAKTPGLADIVRREQDVKQQLGALHARLADALSVPTDQQTAGGIADLRGRIELLKRARLALSAQITREFPVYAELLTPPPATVEAVRATLRPDEALVSTLVLPDRAFVWAISQTGPVAFATVPAGEAALGQAVAELRKAVDPKAQTLGEIPPFDLARAYELYRMVLEPVRAGWESARSLLVVAHGPLGQLPVALFPTAPTPVGPEQPPLFSNYRQIPWLIRTHAVTMLPTVTSLATLRALPPPDRTRRPFVGFGDPLFNAEAPTRPEQSTAARDDTSDDVAVRSMSLARRSSPRTEGLDSNRLALLPRLSDTADEIRSIAVAMQADLTKEVFVGAHANERTVKTLDLSRFKVLVFATHGLVPGDLDGLTQPALALSAPSAAGIEGDGLLTMDEILGLRLNADWVVLSACNTGSAQGAGAEAVSGLGRAFFYAGARALLVSNWPVETTSARTLTTELFRRQQADPDLSRAQALRETMLWVIDQGALIQPRTNRVVASYAHPLFWAPFTLVGDGGGTAPR
jgi:CHAT domain-containing protein